MKKNTLITNFLLLIGLITIIYGFYSRMTNTYIFWESKYIGWLLLFMGIIGTMILKIQRNKSKNKKSILQILVIGLMIFAIGFQVSWISFVPMTEYYKKTEKHIRQSKFIKEELGEIISIQLLPSGKIKTEKNLEGEKIFARLNFIVKGDKKFSDVSTSTLKEFDTDEWLIEINDY